jgi:hypothetical protein
LSSHPPMQSAVSNTFASDVAPTPGGIAAKLESRLLSSKTLSKEVNIVILSLHSALKLGGDEGGDDSDESGRFNEPQIVNPFAAANQRGAIEASEDNYSDSGDDSSGSTDSARGSGSLQHGMPSLLPVLFCFWLNEPFSTASRRCITDSRNRVPLLADAFKWLHSGWLRHRLE